MFRTKKDVDKHVNDINSKIKLSSERNLKGYSIAKLYFGVEDYENAKRYLASYLLEKDTNSVAHKLNGQISEKLNLPEKALESYKRAYELDQTNDLVLKICSLMLEQPIEPGRAKYWVEVAEKAIPHNDIVYKLRESMLAATEGENSPALETFLLEEIKARPQEVGLRVRLVTLLQRSGRTKEGFKMCSDLEQKQLWFTSREWHGAVVELCENYQVQFKAACDSKFYSLYLSGLDRLFDIQTRDGAGLALLSDILHRMDLALWELCSLSPPVSANVFSHWKSQFMMNCATLLIKRAVKDEAVWREYRKLVGQLYVGAWTGELDQDRREVASASKVVAGHMLLSLALSDPEWSDRLHTSATSTGTGEKIFRAVFVTRDQREKSAASWLYSQTHVLSIVSLPTVQEISSYAADYVSLHSQDLHMLTWLILQHYSAGKVLDLSFHLPGAGAVFPRENLSAVDLSSFLYGLGYCLGWQRDSEEARLVPLPPSLAVVMVTRVQEDWWSVACRALAGTIQPADRRTLQHGVDSLRCSGLHGLDINLTMKLAKTFQHLGLESEAVTDGDAVAGDVVKELNTRAGLYYSASLAGLERLERGAAVREPSVRLLQPAGNTPSIVEMDKMKEAAHFFLACQKMKEGRHEEALNSFKDQKSPYASFYMGEIYKKLALEEVAQTGLEFRGRMRELLVESREALYLTLDRLRGLGAGGHPLDSQLSEHLEEVESLLNSQGSNGGDTEVEVPVLGTPPRRGDSLAARRVLSQQLTSTPQRSIFDGNVSGVRSEARPSPERLDVQMRHLTGELSRTNTELAKTVASVGDTTEVSKAVSAVKDVVDTNNKILADIKDNLRNISDDMRELRRDYRTRDDRILDMLKKISDNTDKAAVAAAATASASASTSNSRASEMSAEERLLFESLGLTSGSLASLLHYQHQHQQMIQQQLARQTPNIMASMANMANMGYGGMNNMYGAGMFSPVASGGPSAAAGQRVAAPPALPQHPLAPVSQRAPPSAPSNVVISVSDPIPQTVPVITAPMTVTVPPQHRLGGLSNSPRGVTVSSTPSTPQAAPKPREETVTTPLSAYKTPQLTPHSYQMRMPNGASPLTVSPFKIDEDPAVVFTTQSLLSSIPSPVISAVTPSPEKAAPLSVTKTRVASGPATKATNQEAGEEESPETYEPETDFVPVIPLPEVVDVVTGEEEEEIVFEERAKLFRYCDETKEWKERGLGQAKILLDGNTGKFRFLMRREQTFKICANHKLIPNMKVDKMASNAKARIWGAQDFAEEELKTEKFCIKFKTEEQADNFERKFKESVIKSVDAKSPTKPAKDKENDAEKVSSGVMTIGVGGGFKFGSGAASSTTTVGLSSSAKSTITTTSSFTFGSNAAVSTVSTTSEPSATLGGFSFSSTPVVKSVPDRREKQNDEKKDVAKPSPFAAFSFGGSAGSKIENISAPQTSQEETAVLGSSSDSNLTFKSLSGGEGFKADPNFKGFAGTGSSLFGGQKKEDDGGDEGGAEEEYEPDVHFKPVVPLPELVETKTGEEEEEILFSHRAKLFRFVSETKEWKERGIGDFKILKHKESGKVRFLMRREQVLKVCCNHFLSTSMEFKPLSSSDKAWQWSAPDFSEGEVVNELLAVKFKTAELANDWKKVVDDCLTKLVESPVKNTSKPENKVTEAKPAKGGQTQTLAQFAAAQKQSSWECPLCLTRNDNSKIQCVACEAARPGYEEEVKKLKDAEKPAAAVMTIGAGGGFKFGSGAASSTSTSTGGFSFGSTTTSTSQNTGFSFGTPSTTSKANGDGTKSPFGSSSSHQFSFSGVVSPLKPTVSPRKHNESTNSENELYQDDEADNLYFEPVIPLPDKVETKTGEEEESVLYSHRAKLFRFTGGEWKERGLGDIKILKNVGTGKVRLLMRREQVLKICLNHYVTSDLVAQFQPQDTKSWTWAAQDFSDGELESMTFALRFKTPEICSEFKKALDEAAENATSSPTKSTSKSKSAEVSSTSTSTAEKSTEKIKIKENVDSTADERLFSPEDFKPIEKLDKEVELSFDGQGLKLNSEEDAREVCEKISSQGAINTLTFSGNTIGIQAAGAIGRALETQPELRRAHWKDMFTGRMKTEIPPALVNMTRGLMVAKARLVELDLSDNAFGPVGMEGLKTFLKSPSCFSLQELKLNNTGCGVTGGKMLANLLLDCYERSKAVGHPLALKVFILGRSRQENEGATALAKVFKLMGSLEEVVMPQNGIYHEGLTALADAFSSNPNLRILNMNDNTFTAKGAKAMASALKKLNKLEVLNLGDCLLKSGGTKLICKALAGNHSALRELVLDSNEIRLKGGLEIVNAVKDKPDLAKLSIDANQFGSSGLKKIMEKLEEIGKKDIVGDTEDNEEPDSDEEDPDVSDEEQEVEVREPCQPSQPFSNKSNEGKSPAQALLGVSSKTVFGESGSSASIFGGSTNKTSFKPSGNIFTSPPPAQNSVFGNTTNTSSPSIFGGSGSTSNSIFGTPTGSKETKEGTPASSLFTKLTEKKDSSPSIGSSVFGSSSNTSKSTGLFGKGPSQDAASVSSTTGGSLFGSSSPSGFDFKALADNSGPGFSTAKEGFMFAGAGASLFGKQNKTGNEDGEDEEDADADGHDPHFEPIVPLPELVEVRTGEEEEEEVFKHRAKVYRFCSDSKQWKERGVGDIKILRHPVTGITRVILRRDQVLKIALNHRITREMELKPLANSETSWCWFAMDFSEGHEETGSMEQLAVRFKGKETAVAFKAKFEECQENVGKAAAASVKSRVLNEETVSEQAEDNEGDEEECEEEEEYVDEEEYDNGETTMFHNNATLYLKDSSGTDFISQGEVDLKIVYDDDVYGARILAELPTATSEEESIVCNHLIAMQTNLEDMKWSALDFSTDPPIKRTFRVEFEEEEIATEFKDIFEEGKELAEQSEILETVGDQDPHSFYYGQGADGE